MEVRAAVLHEAGGPLRVETVSLDPPRAGEVLVRVAAAGVCHSDVRLADGDLGDGRWPTVLGHEGAGIVEAVGAGVGTAVGWIPSAVCRSEWHTPLAASRTSTSPACGGSSSTSSTTSGAPNS